jgi:hypothetical protein
MADYQNMSQKTYDRLLANVQRNTAPSRADLRDLLRAYEDALTLLDAAVLDSYSALDGTHEFLYCDNGQPRVTLREEPPSEDWLDGAHEFLYCDNAPSKPLTSSQNSPKVK